MPVKSTFSAEIGEGFDKFKEFEKLFGKYRDALGKMPSAYASISKSNKETEDALKGMTAAIIAQLEVLAKEQKLQERMEDSTKRMASYWDSIQKSTRSFWGSISGIASTLRNSTIISGLLGAGGLWGMDRIGVHAGNLRRAANGLGMPAGDLSAFGLTYQRSFDAQGLLSAVSAGRGNIGGPEASALMTLGVSPTGSPTDVARKALQRIYRLAKDTPEALLGPLLQEGYGAGALGFSIEDLRRLKGMDEKEFAKYGNQFDTRAKQLGIDDNTLRRWQDFVNTLDTTGKRIEGGLIRGLVDATGPLEKLSEAAANAVDKFVGSKSFGWLVEKISQGLETFANYLGTEKFKQDMRDIAAGFEQIGKWAMQFMRWVAPPPSGSASEQKRDDRIRGYQKNNPIFKWFGDQWGQLTVPRLPDGTRIQDTLPPGYTRTSAAGATTTGSALLDLIARLENSPDINGRPQVSPAGAIGKYQIMPSTAWGYGVTRDQLMDPATNQATAEKLLADLSKRYKGDTAQILAAYNAGPMIADYLKASGNTALPRKRPSDGADWDYRQTQDYLRRAGFNVKIEDHVGVNVSTQATMLAGSYPGVVP